MFHFRAVCVSIVCVALPSRQAQASSALLRSGLPEKGTTNIQVPLGSSCLKLRLLISINGRSGLAFS